MMQPDLLTRSLLNTALTLFRDRGYADVDPSHIAEQAGIPIDDLYSRFPTKQAFVIGLFERISQHLQSAVTEAPDSTVANRFRFLMQRVIALIEPYREMLRELLPAMLNPRDRIGVLGPSTDRIRAESQGVYALLVLGAQDRPAADQTDSLIQLLYFAHLGLIFLYLQDQRDDPEFVDNGLEFTCDMLTVVQKTLLCRQQNWCTNQIAQLFGFPRPDRISQRLDRLVRDYLHPPHDSAHFTQAENVLRELFRFRRLLPGSGQCETVPCRQCMALHLPKVQQVMSQGQPLTLVLPAFPAKSANLRKVTGALPDFGEELALRFLQDRCDAVAEIYEPGAQLIICSDGRVFSDIVGVDDDDVTAYRRSLIEMIERCNLQSLLVFDLDEVCSETDFSAMRGWLVDHYGEPLQALEQRTRQFADHQQLFNGIHRFMFEDLVERDQKLSRSQARKRSKDLAFEVIRRSNSWSRVLTELFPAALRLSIHPHSPHSDKIGILLGDADDLWLTPWHGVALLQSDRFQLTRRSEAEARGALLVERDGRASHFEMPDADSAVPVPGKMKSQ